MEFPVYMMPDFSTAAFRRNTAAKARASCGIMEAVIVAEEVAAACSGLATSPFDNSLGCAPLLVSTMKSCERNICRQLPWLSNVFALPRRSRSWALMRPA